MYSYQTMTKDRQTCTQTPIAFKADTCLVYKLDTNKALYLEEKKIFSIEHTQKNTNVQMRSDFMSHFG